MGVFSGFAETVPVARGRPAGKFCGESSPRDIWDIIITSASAAIKTFNRNLSYAADDYRNIVVKTDSRPSGGKSKEFRTVFFASWIEKIGRS